jgi:UDP-3-O-[3-hydroxymyristoyl] glucosamine N-acyltransferase
VIGGATSVLGNINERGVYIGAFPWMPQAEWRRVAVEVRRLRELSSRVAGVERALQAQQASDQGGKSK